MRLRLAGFVIAAVSLATAQSAFAADMPTKAPADKVAAPATTWTGCYVGANAGGGWSNDHFNFTTSGLDEGGHTSSGFAAGGQVGCDYQFAPSWVVGVKGMWDWANLKGNHTVDFLIPPSPFTTKITSFGSATARLGYTVTPVSLLYGKAGFGWVKNEYEFLCGVGCFDSASGTRTGLDLGVGFEWMISGPWSITFDYDHVFLRDKIFTFTGTGLFNETIGQSVNVALLGLNYRFGR
jgi:outer membrane immunogenic protein